jgi:endonuclease/exonuclease/phosphatase family metal-dependent hydrolase
VHDALRVVTYNVHFGDDVARLARALASDPEIRDADVLLLQEIESYLGDRRAEALARQLGFDMVYAPARLKRDGTHGLALLSRYPIRDVEVMTLHRYELGWGTRRRVAMIATLDWNGLAVRVVNAHLDTRLTLDQRRAQILPVLERVADAPHVVVGGDMNTISCLAALLPGVPICLPGLSQGPAFDRYMRGLGFETPFARIGGTGPLHQRLDAIFTRGFEVLAFDKADDVSVSDHVPLWAELRRPSVARPESARVAPIGAPPRRAPRFIIRHRRKSHADPECPEVIVRAWSLRPRSRRPGVRRATRFGARPIPSPDGRRPPRPPPSKCFSIGPSSWPSSSWATAGWPWRPRSRPWPSSAWPCRPRTAASPTPRRAGAKRPRPRGPCARA